MRNIIFEQIMDCINIFVLGIIFGASIFGYVYLVFYLIKKNNGRL